VELSAAQSVNEPSLKHNALQSAVGTGFDRESEVTMETLIKDLRYGAKRLLTQPGFTIVGVLSIALGIGVNT
jgi:hypothetical protein